jgi:hypothetical protein
VRDALGRACRQGLGAALLLAWLVMPSPAPPGAAVTARIVDQRSDACSGAGPGTWDRPYCTIQQAASAATAGETVQVAAGTYAEDVSPRNSGAAGAPVTFRPAPGATVTITGTPGATASKMRPRSAPAARRVLASISTAEIGASIR